MDPCQIISLLFLMYILWIVFLWLHHMAHQPHPYGRSNRGKKPKFQTRKVKNSQGVPPQPHSSAKVVLMPSSLGVSDLYPPSVPANAPMIPKSVCPSEYEPSGIPTQSKGCIYSKARGVDKYNIYGLPFFENNKVYKCPTGQKRQANTSIHSADACTGDPNNWSSFIGPKFREMVTGDRFILQNKH